MTDRKDQPGWITTYTGARFWPLDPREEDVRMADIVGALPHVNRYNGHTIWPYSVAAHSVTLFEYGQQVVGAPDEELAWALLHDAAEVYFGDFPTPVKRELPELRVIDKRIRDVIMAKYGLPAEEPEWLVYADRNACRDEGYVLFPSPPEWLDELEPLGIDIPRWNVDEARRAYLQRLQLVLGEDVLAQ